MEICSRTYLQVQLPQNLSNVTLTLTYGRLNDPAPRKYSNRVFFFTVYKKRGSQPGQREIICLAAQFPFDGFFDSLSSLLVPQQQQKTV